jgi:hypothetical protein
MAQRREGGSPSPQAHLSSDAHAAAAAAAGQGSAAQRDVRGAWRGRATRPAAAEENPLNKCLPAARRQGGAGWWWTCNRKGPNRTSHFLPFLLGSVDQEFKIRMITAAATFFFHSFLFLSFALIPGLIDRFLLLLFTAPFLITSSLMVYFFFSGNCLLSLAPHFLLLPSAFASPSLVAANSCYEWGV